MVDSIQPPHPRTDEELDFPLQIPGSSMGTDSGLRGSLVHLLGTVFQRSTCQLINVWFG